MASIDYKESIIREASRPQEGRYGIAKASISNLNDHEFQKMNRIIDDEYNERQETILDKPFGEVINNTVNFFGNSVDTYYSKVLEAEFSQNIYDTQYSSLDKLQKYLIALVLFIRDDDNVIYLGIILIILSVLICFFNISRSYGYSEPTAKP